MNPKDAIIELLCAGGAENVSLARLLCQSQKWDIKQLLVEYGYAKIGLKSADDFIQLITLKIDGKGLKQLPQKLPDGIQILNVSGNKLRQLPTLPKSLQRLYCYNNSLSELPADLGNLKLLNARGNQLESLPELPQSMSWLDLAFNRLKTLPKQLPRNLNFFNCGFNQLTDLPQLNDKLFKLNCEYNQLTTLPALPDSLQGLECQNNQISQLPAFLPKSLLQIMVRNNPIADLSSLKANWVERSNGDWYEANHLKQILEEEEDYNL